MNKPALLLVAALFLSAVLFPFAVTAQTPPTLVFIMPDGTVDGTDFIERSGDLYTLTANTSATITVQKSNIVLDGLGHALGGDEFDDDSVSVILEDISNVTIQNLDIKTSGSGMMLTRAPNCNVLNVNIWAERAGIRLREANSTTVTGCYVEAFVEYGLNMYASHGSVVTNNSILSSMIDTLNCGSSSNCILSDNLITYIPSQYPLARGIQIDNSANCTIANNRIKNYPLSGIDLQLHADNNRIQANQVLNCSRGINLNGANNNLTANLIADNNDTGITLSSENNILRNNTLQNNAQPLAVSAYSSSSWINDVDTSNTVDGKSIIYWVNQIDRAVPLDAGFVVLVNCTCITVEGFTFNHNANCLMLSSTTNSTIIHNNFLNGSTLTLYSSSDNNLTQNSFTNNSHGIKLSSFSFNNIIFANNFATNSYGIYLSESSSNTLSSNNFTQNQNALYFSSASNNNILLNNFQNNTNDVTDAGMNNPYTAVSTAASTSPKIQTLAYFSVQPLNFIGPPPLSANNYDNGKEGNYWSNYTGTDANGDGIGDTSHFLYGNNADNYPLMLPAAVTIPEFSSLLVVALLFAATSLLLGYTRKTRKKP
ncbi:MAG: right-handed parallel beta-helix repeat-containing protein [Candidatus Bathyarchaeota archaeon]|nr:right-handed parallel beta-helix repeat-containing protein [Candidatus Bathyarchaeota archaeon]